MSWPFALYIKRLVQGEGLIKQAVSPQGQRGAFSPLLFGMLMGMVLFSGVSAQWAKQELVRYQKFQAEKAKAQASDVAKAMDFAILTEEKHTYSEDYSLKRALAYSNSSAKTRGKQDFLVNVQDNRDPGRFDQNRKTIAIAATDDTLLRAQVYRAGSARDIQNISSSRPVAVYDTSTARNKQVRDSNARMEGMGEQIYAFVAAHRKFPTPEEFTALSNRFGLTDVWGQSFTYTPGDDTLSGTLSFTTPWGYTQTLNLSLKEETPNAP